MNLFDEKSFEKACGKMMPLRRNMSIFNGDKFQCACGSEHAFDINIISVLPIFSFDYKNEKIKYIQS